MKSDECGGRVSGDDDPGAIALRQPLAHHSYDLGGGQIGYNWQIDRLVDGAEAGADFCQEEFIKTRSLPAFAENSVTQRRRNGALYSQDSGAIYC